jgi:DNA-binding transcriptional ArsR family regulator
VGIQYAAEHRIQLHLIGKLHASRLDPSVKTRICCQELEEQLQVGSASVRKRLSGLREAGLIRESRPRKIVYCEMERSRVKETVDRIGDRQVRMYA